MLDLNLLTGFNGMLEPLPVFQPGLRLHALIRPRQQQHAVDITRQTGKLIAVLVTQRMCEGRSQLGSVTGKMDIREAFKIIRDFGLRFCIQEAAPAARHQKLGQRQFCRGVLRAVDHRLRGDIGMHQRFSLGQQVT